MYYLHAIEPDFETLPSNLSLHNSIGSVSLSMESVCVSSILKSLHSEIFCVRSNVQATFHWIDLARLSLAAQAQASSSDGCRNIHKPREAFTLPLNTATEQTFAPPPPPPSVKAR